MSLMNRFNSRLDINVRAKTKLLEEKTRVNIHDLKFGNGFLDMTPKT